MNWKWKILMLFGIVALITGCNKLNTQSLTPLNELVPNCNKWTICTEPIQNVYNVTNPDCINGLNTRQAQEVVDVLIQNNVNVDMKCVEFIKEVNPTPVAKIVDLS